ncbi:GL22819 [Drosophila persimilis]|uniref:GL22819 n=1 Tax=Drosophila persimilis TaxID=7234 RepID=B4GZH9_DROPE|nr:GL22819 [Drosophila persimilis]
MGNTAEEEFLSADGNTGEEEFLSADGNTAEEAFLSADDNTAEEEFSVQMATLSTRTCFVFLVPNVIINRFLFSDDDP